jgi:hypothetical protein
MTRTVALTRVVLSVSLAATAAWTPLPCQQVILSEVRADAAESWIELHNRGAAAADLSSHTIYYASRTPGQPQTYWWGFPAGTVLEAGGFLRVHWYLPAPSSPEPGELYTGATVFHFLFGYGGEPLRPDRGALALLASQQSPAMNTAAAFVDFICWGESGFPREDLAVQAGSWTTGASTPAIPAGQSLARDVSILGQMPSRALEWFVDPTPTPRAANLGGASVTPHGQSCTVHGHRLLGAPELSASSLPLAGSATFGFRVGATTGVYGEHCVLVFSAAAAPQSLPSILPQLPGQGCREAIDPRFVLGTMLQRTHAVETAFAMPLTAVPAAAAGTTFHAQAIVLDLLPFAWPPYQGITNALAVEVGL